MVTMLNMPYKCHILCVLRRIFGTIQDVNKLMDNILYKNGANNFM